MKTLFRKSLIAVVVLSSFAMTAFGATPFIKIKSHDEKKFSLLITSAGPSPVMVSLKDANDYEFYSQQLNSNEAFGKKFDLKSLPDGTYFLEVENKETIIVYTLSIEAGQLEIQKDRQLVINKPYIRQEGNKVDVAMLNSGLPLELAILNPTSDLIFEDTLTGKDKKGKRYDMSYLNPGFYTMLVTVEGRNFRHYINIK